MEEVQPLSSLEELMEWSMPCLTSNIHRERLRVRPFSSHLRTLVCHDMKGGYLDDRFVSGTSNKDAYRFYHWSGVDTFVYFSHHLVTIPPLGWINAAHLHGVPVLGTFITEWEAGSAVCKDLLNDVKTVTQAVQKLVNIAKYYGFDGWLINIENEVPIDKVPLMLMFVEKLTVAMRNVRYDENCHHRVIWYDSVTENGELKWQNELNSQNYAFFFACDGIFLNYTWTEDHLVRSRKAAGTRHGDIFVGLDVFGRNFYAGGKYNTWKAMEVVRKHNLSAAIFAPGWTYETQPDFIEAERRLWGSLSPFLTHQGIEDLPFTTSFCQGFGENLFIKGKVEKEGPWHNLSQQHLQPLWSQEGEEGNCHLSLVTQEAYNGGGCLGITTHSPTTVRFMLCNLECNQLLRVTVAYKWSSQPTALTFLCHLSPDDPSFQERILELACEEGEENDDETQGDAHEGKKVIRCCPETSHVENGWNIRSFTTSEIQRYKLTLLMVRLGGAAELRLGHLDLLSEKVPKVCLNEFLALHNL